MQISLFRKLILANVFYAIPVLVLVLLMVGSKNVNIDFAKWETKGNQIQKPLERLLESVAKSRLVAVGTLASGETGVARFSQSFASTDRAFGDLKIALGEVGEDLQFTAEGLGKRKREHLKFETVLKKWENAKREVPALSAEKAADSFNALIADVRGLITHAGDTSNLILDPDLDSYYLMDVTLLALPQTQDRLQDIAVKVSAWLEEGLNAGKRVDVAVMAALLKQSDLDRVVADYQTVITEDPNFSGESPTLKSKLGPAVEAYSKSQTTLIDLLTRIAADGKVNQKEFNQVALRAHDDSYRVWEASVAELDTLLERRLSLLNRDKWISLSFALLALVVSCGLLFWVAISFNLNMKRVLSKLQASLFQTSQSSGELVKVAEELSRASNSQASAIQETAATLDEIASMAMQSKDGALQMSHAAEDSHAAAETGRSSVQSMNQMMGEVGSTNEEILSQMQRSNEEVSRIVKIIGEIANKTKVIHDIVFQTKLLSFNASVEAARAGEHGKGFSVVADEVGKLAQMSGSAAEDIGKMVDTSIRQVEEIVRNTQSRMKEMVERGRKSVAGGTRVAKDCSESIESIVSSVEVVRGKVAQVAAASEEQAKGVGEISKAMNELDRTVNENTQLSRKTSDYSNGLADQATSLASLVETLEREVLGTRQKSPEISPVLKFEKGSKQASSLEGEGFERESA